jgi:hypothetical protein
VAAAAGDPGDKPAGGGVIVPRLIKWGRPGVALTQSSTTACSIRLARRKLQDTGEMASAQGCKSNIPRPRISQLGHKQTFGKRPP